MTKVFGLQVGARLYPLIYQCFSLAILTQFILYSIIGDNYRVLFIIFCCLAGFAGIVLHIFHRDNVNWKAKNKVKSVRRNSSEPPKDSDHQ